MKIRFNLAALSDEAICLVLEKINRFLHREPKEFFAGVSDYLMNEQVRRLRESRGDHAQAQPLILPDGIPIRDALDQALTLRWHFRNETLKHQGRGNTPQACAALFFNQIVQDLRTIAAVDASQD